MNTPDANQVLRGATIAFTGRLVTLSRADAHARVAAAGGVVVASVTRRTSHLVVGMGGWPLLRDGAVGQKLLRAEQLNSRGANIQILSERRLREAIGLDPDERIEKTLSAERICELLEIDPPTLARWEQLSLVQSDAGKYDFQDVVALREIIRLVGRGVRPETIAASLHQLARIIPGAQRPLAQLRIVAEHNAELLAEIDGALVDPDGQLRLNFDASAGAGAVDPGPAASDPRERAWPRPLIAPIRAPARAESARTFFDRGVAAEEEDDLDEAAAHYRRAVELDAGYAEAWFNLGAVLREAGQLAEALAAYERAVACDGRMAEAWYNLADAREQSGHVKGAIEALCHAIEARPDYADAHFNLAHCYETAGERKSAAAEWRAYLRLDPSGPWAELARQRLTLLESRSG